MDPADARELLASIDADRLLLICGAGLSMAPPSSTPSARDLAQSCAQKFTSATLQQVPLGADTDLESLADFFLSNPTRRAAFVNKYVDWAQFNGLPNSGHKAVADLLCCRAVEAVVTTNFDPLLESAAEALGERDLRPAVDGNGAACHHQHATLLKVHGCMRRDRDRILWSRLQIEEEGPLYDAQLRQNILSSKTWIEASLRGHDLVFIGFWTDWSYLNDILERIMQESAPGSVFLVDTAEPGELERKAPRLWALANHVGLRRVPQSGADFLDELRVLYSRVFCRNLLRESIPTYRTMGGATDPPDIDFPADLASDDYYALRRDLCGTPSDQAVRKKRPEQTTAVAGAAHLLLRDRAAELAGPIYRMPDGSLVRVVNGAGQVLSLVRSRFSTSQPQAGVPEVVICCCEADGGVPEDVARGGRPATIVRAGSEASWVTLTEARERKLI